MVEIDLMGLFAFSIGIFLVLLGGAQYSRCTAFETCAWPLALVIIGLAVCAAIMRKYWR